MATCTKRELVEQAAAKVGAKAAGQPLAVEDFDTLDHYADQLFDQLGEDEILTIADEDSIPASLCPWLAILIANLAASEYGGQTDVNIKSSMEAIIRRITRQKETLEPQTVDYF